MYPTGRHRDALLSGLRPIHMVGLLRIRFCERAPRDDSRRACPLPFPARPYPLSDA